MWTAISPFRPFNYFRTSGPVDVIVAGSFQRIPELLPCSAPVLYWEQGHECLFGDLKGYPQIPHIPAADGDFLFAVCHYRRLRSTLGGFQPWFPMVSIQSAIILRPI